MTIFNRIMKLDVPKGQSVFLWGARSTWKSTFLRARFPHSIYVGIYLKEEIQAENLVRNLPGFAKFLDIAGFCNGELVDYINIARDCGIDAKQ